MQLSFLGFGSRRRASRILRLSTDAFVLCIPVDGSTWTLHYLLRGSFGNYLLGGPPFDDGLARIAEAIGGIAKVLPFESGTAGGAERWFTRFGCRWVAPLPAERLTYGAVPVDSIDDSAFTGLRDVGGDVLERGYRWRFGWRGAAVSAGFVTESTEAAAVGRRRLVLPHSIVGSARDLDRAVVTMQAALSPARPSEWLHRLSAGEPLLCVPVDALGIVACFDDIEFERNDIEIIGPRQRRDLADLLARQGFERVTPHCYRHPAAVVRVCEPPRTQMSEPLDGVELEPGAITFVTATQAAFQILLAGWSVERRVEALRGLVARLPVNLRKVDTALKRRPHLIEGHDAARLLARLRGLQAEAVAYYKPRRPGGLRGRLFRPETEGAGHDVADDADTPGLRA